MTSARTVAWWGAVGVAVLTLLVRLPLVGLPLDPDEGGYAYIARRWAAGEPWNRDRVLETCLPLSFAMFR